MKPGRAAPRRAGSAAGPESDGDIEPEFDEDPDRGLDLAPVDGVRSSGAVGREVTRDALRVVDPAAAAAIRASGDWRAEYQPVFRRLVEAGLSQAADAEAIARVGLAGARARMQFTRAGRSLDLAEAMATTWPRRIDTVVVPGRGRRTTELAVPLGGQILRDRALAHQLDDWEFRGMLEPSAAAAVRAVMDHPEWLDLRDTSVALLGAGAEMGPLVPLLEWGAHVIAVDAPRRHRWDSLLQATVTGAGQLAVPVPVGSHPDPRNLGAVAAVAGADLLRETPEIRQWIATHPDPLVLACHAYADGVTHVRLMAAQLAVVDTLAAGQPLGVSVAHLATPTDVYAIPPEAVAECRSRWEARRVRSILQAPVRRAGMFQPHQPAKGSGAGAAQFGITDALLSQQGPNYALAKRLQRWHAINARAQGHLVSMNVAPATRTASVLRNRALRAAYSGAGRFGVEIFEPATTTVLMAALLVRDLRDPTGPSNPNTPLDHPERLLMDAAVHGGMWRLAYAPRSVLPFAALSGLPAALLPAPSHP